MKTVTLSEENCLRVMEAINDATAALQNVLDSIVVTPLLKLEARQSRDALMGIFALFDYQKEGKE